MLAGMVTVANRIFVSPDYAARFEDSFRNRARLVDEMPGFVSNMLLRPTREGDPYVVLTLWRSRLEFEAWTRSDAFLKGHARSGTLPREAFTAPNRLEVHEVVLDSTRPDLQPEPPAAPAAERP